jgi:hypothetical protein
LTQTIILFVTASSWFQRTRSSPKASGFDVSAGRP